RQLINLNNFQSANTKTTPNHPSFKTMPFNLHPLNTILFGPPGTGKTFNTINKALDILGEDLNGKTRKEIKSLYESKVNEGQVIFTTFHQSMTYEDFIEGIKPLEPKEEGQPISYRVIDGILKRVCALAAYNCYKVFTSRLSKN